jgi:hypothetical protein
VFHVDQGSRDRSRGTPAPVRSGSAAVRPMSALSSAVAGPDTAGPAPWCQSVSVAP